MTIHKFWKKVSVVEENDCWNWLGCCLKKNGKPTYGSVRYQKVAYTAHRLAYILTFGDLKTEDVVGHTCNNKLCCNPNHLYVYSQYNTPESFWSRIQSSNENDCWPWTGSTTVTGYGQVRFKEQRWIASRLAFHLSNPDVELNEEMFVCHKCDNPPCCNPSHLFLGTPEDNMLDKISKGREKTRASFTTAISNEIFSQAKDLTILYNETQNKYNLMIDDLSKKYGVSKRSIYDLVRYRLSI